MNVFCVTVSSGKAVGAADSRAAPAAAASSSTAVGNKQAMRNWETLVLFAVNLSRLDVMVNMSNVMGNTVYAGSCSNILFFDEAITLLLLFVHNM